MGKSLLTAIGTLTVADLQRIRIDLHGRKDLDAHHYGLQLYGSLHLTHEGYGLHETHDQAILIFHSRQFEHAFFTTSDKYSCPERKDVLRRGSIERIRWIMPLIKGQVCGSACFEVPSPNGRRKPPNRLYAIYATPFVVWLEPRKESGWKFSSAYPCSIEEIHKYSRGGRTVCKWKEAAP